MNLKLLHWMNRKEENSESKFDVTLDHSEKEI